MRKGRGAVNTAQSDGEVFPLTACPAEGAVARACTHTRLELDDGRGRLLHQPCFRASETLSDSSSPDFLLQIPKLRETRRCSVCSRTHPSIHPSAHHPSISVFVASAEKMDLLCVRRLFVQLISGKCPSF